MDITGLMPMSRALASAVRFLATTPVAAVAVTEKVHDHHPANE